MRIVAALSGGVDSAVAAARLVREGAEVVGVHYRTGVVADGGGAAAGRSCCGADDAFDARAVAERLSIPFFVLDLSDAFRAGVVDPFVAAYAAGRTPNPCVDCNRRVKFGRLADLARSFGAEAVATGHYARTSPRPGGGAFLRRGRDPAKDQSYVLAGLDAEALSFARFPLGSSTKEEVRAEARALGLAVADKRDSQELCFVPTGNPRDALRERAPGRFRGGDVVDEEGRTVGRHDGAIGFTPGQRRGVRVATGRPLHVAAVDPERNVLSLAPRASLLAREVVVRDSLWHDPSRSPPAGAAYPVEARIRHGGEPTPALLLAGREGRATVRFEADVFAPAPGQALVAYRGDLVVFAAEIDAVGARRAPAASRALP